MPLSNTEFFAPGNFQVADPMQRYLQPEEVQAFNKSYDQLSVMQQPMLQSKFASRAAGVAVSSDAALRKLLLQEMLPKMRSAR